MAASSQPVLDLGIRGKVKQKKTNLPGCHPGRSDPVENARKKFMARYRNWLKMLVLAI
jgi:hypothetical protein